MTGDEGRQVFEAMRPQEERDRLCQPCGVIERQRTRPLGMVVRAMVMSAGTPGGAYQADVVRSSLACAVPQVTRAACYRCFDTPLAPGLAALAARALAYAQAQQVDRPGPRRGVPDWYRVDATPVTGREALRADVPGTGADAAMQGHKGLSVGCGAPVRDHVSPAREHDRRPLTSDASGRGCGLLADRGYASMARLRACEAPDVRVVLRRKDHWQPKVDDSARGQVTRAFFPGTDRDALLADDTLVLDGRAMDADGPGGGDQPPRPLRRVGVQTPTGYSFCLTTLPPQLGPLQVADLSRGRWEVERSLRLDQSVTRRDALDAERPCALKTLLHASLMASTIAAVLAHTHHLKTHPPQAGAPRTEAPLHPRLLAWQLAVSCQSMAQAFDLRGTAAKRPWDTSAAWRTHAGNDPNWRRRPSVLDQ